MLRWTCVFLTLVTTPCFADTQVFSPTEFKSEYLKRGYAVEAEYLGALEKEIESFSADAVVIVRAELVNIDDDGQFHFQILPGQANPNPAQVFSDPKSASAPTSLLDNVVKVASESVVGKVLYVQSEALDGVTVDLFKVHTIHESGQFFLSHWGLVGFRAVAK